MHNKQATIIDCIPELAAQWRVPETWQELWAPAAGTAQMLNDVLQQRDASPVISAGRSTLEFVVPALAEVLDVNARLQEVCCVSSPLHQ